MKKLIFSIITIAIAGVVAVAPVFAEDKCTLTSVLASSICDLDGTKLDDFTDDYNKQTQSPCFCPSDGTDEAAVRDILLIVVNILSVGVGILGVLGITITGIQYLTAGGSEEKTKKSQTPYV